MAVVLEEVLKPVSEDAPWGEDLASGHDLFSLNQSCEAARMPGAKADWATLQSQAVALLARSKDLRVAMILARALARHDGLSGAADGLQLITQLVTRYWDQKLYPYKEKNPEVIRTNVLLPLVSRDPSAGYAHDLRLAKVAPETRMGVLLVRDILLSQGVIPAQPGESAKGQEEILAMLNRSQEEHKIVLDGAARALNAVLELRDVLKDRTTASLDFAPLIEALRPVAEVCAGLGGPPLPASLAKAPAEGRTASESSAAPDQVAQPGAAPQPRGGIQNEQDAHRVLEEVCLYLESKHPSHPAPLLIRRAQRLLKKNFLEIIEDLAPSSLDAIRGIGGIKKQ